MSPRKYTEAVKASNRKWDAANLDRISIAMTRGKREIIKAAAAMAGESMNQFIIKAIDRRIESEGLSCEAVTPASEEDDRAE